VARAEDARGVADGRTPHRASLSPDTGSRNLVRETAGCSSDFR